MKKRYIRLGISLLVAIVFSLLLFSQAVDRRVEYAPVVMVSEDVEVNTPLNESNLTIKRLPVGSVSKDALTTIPEGKLAGQQLFKGQLLLPGMIMDEAVRVAQPADRLFSIPVDLVTSATVKAGDYADILFFVDLAKDKERDMAISRVLLSKVQVAEVLTQNGVPVSEPDSRAIGSAAIPAVVQLLVTADEANLLHVASKYGTMSLTKYVEGSAPVEVAPAGFYNAIGLGELQESVNRVLGLVESDEEESPEAGEGQTAGLDQPKGGQ